MQVLKVPSLKRFVRPVLLALFIAGCGDGPVDPLLPVTVSMAPTGPITLYVGDTVTVRYPANNPSQAEISSSNTLKIFLGAVWLLFSAAGTVAGWLLLRLRPRDAA